LLVSSVKDSTAKSYAYAWKHYINFCKEKRYFVESGETLVRYIAYLDNVGYAATTIRSTAVAISSISIRDPNTHKPIGQDVDVIRVLNAVRRHGLKHMKTNVMWDLGAALEKLKDVDDTKRATLTAKTAFLLAITTFWRPASDLSRIAYSSIKFNSEKTEVMFSAIDVKEGAQKSTRLVGFNEKACCPVYTLRKYLHWTKDDEARKNSDRLFISLETHTPLTGERISKLVRQLMDNLGIGGEFKAHSTRATATSTALLTGLPMQWILTKANWSTAATFGKYYKKDCIDLDCAVTNIIQTKLLPQRDEVPISNTSSILNMERVAAEAASEPTHPPRTAMRKS
jgi:integrase-like protein